jgi:hypothetical protein
VQELRTDAGSMLDLERRGMVPGSIFAALARVVRFGNQKSEVCLCMTSINAGTRRSIPVMAPILLLLLQACASAPTDSSPDHEPSPATTEAKASRRTFEGCDPAKEVERYSDRVGENVLITLAWENQNSKSAELQIPALVLRLESPYVVVDFDRDIPNLKFYTSIWLYSGHVKAMRDGSHGVDPCSATMKKGQWQ